MTIQFKRPVQNKVGVQEYFSKCGRYCIVRRRYDYPASTGYVLYELSVDGARLRLPGPDGVAGSTYDYLADAKQAAVEAGEADSNPAAHAKRPDQEPDRAVDVSGGRVRG